MTTSYSSTALRVTPFIRDKVRLQRAEVPKKPETAAEVNAPSTSQPQVMRVRLSQLTVAKRLLHLTPSRDHHRHQHLWIFRALHTHPTIPALAGQYVLQLYWTCDPFLS